MVSMKALETSSLNELFRHVRAGTHVCHTLNIFQEKLSVVGPCQKSHVPWHFSLLNLPLPSLCLQFYTVSVFRVTAPMRIPLFSWLFFIPICSIFLTFSINVVSGQCLDDQKSLLLQFKNSLKFNTTFSTKLVHWNVSRDCCSWEGVTCSNESFSKGHVIGLNLTDESIYVGLDYSSSLFSLQHLQDLSLAYNNFNNSQIPPGFGNLMNLSYLNLSNAGFAGLIPIETSNLERLVTLDLSTVSMLKIENPDLATLVQNFGELKELYLDGVNISASRNEWCQALSSSVPNLRVLSMSNCYLSGSLDSSLLKLQSLSIIRLDNNPLNAPMPEFFANFTNLTSLGLSSCGLNGTIPENIFRILKLQTLDLSYNDLLLGALPEFLPNGSLRSLLLSGIIFSGALPDSIGNLTMLSRLDLSYCNFNGSIPNSLANLTQLIYLDMSHNKFNGQIPSFSMAKNLTEINLSFNDLGGGITSTRWEELINLVNLDLGYNSIEGSIPMSLFSHPSIQKLRLSNNKFSGGLREFNGSSYPLDTLDLSSNNLEGPFPVSVISLPGIKSLSFSYNKFNGSFQLDAIQQLRNLSSLDLSYNKMSVKYSGTASSLPFPQFSTFKLASCNLSTFPDFLKNQSKLTILDLSKNEIYGEIPDWIWKFNNLMYLNLSHNHLVTRQEPLPNLPARLSILDLHSNKLQGQLPHLPPLVTYLDFSMNNFSSVIPTSIGISLNSTIFLSLSSNKFHGEIPQSLCNGTYLLVLDLSNNSLSGTIPQCFYAMSETLGVLNLRRNNLNGTISDKFPGKCGLQTLSLNSNLLRGKLPMSLANCTNLEVLDIGNNHIEDVFPCYLRNISSLRVLVLRSNNFYGSIGCDGSNVTWPILQIVDLASNNFTGQFPNKSFSTWKAMMANEDEVQSVLNHLRFEVLQLGPQIYYQDMITVTSKGLAIELVKILTVFTSIDISANKLNGSIPGDIGELKSLYIFNLSHNALTGKIPPSLRNLSELESLDLSSNMLTGEIPTQLTDLTFLAVLNLSFNQLTGPIPYIKQFSTFSEDSYEGNKYLCGKPLKTECIAVPRLSSPTFEETHSNSGIVIDWNFISAELGFFLALGLSLDPLCIGRGGGYGITSTLMTFFSASSLSCILEKRIAEDEHGGIRSGGTIDS
ncbi:receptor-like protein 7 [Quercus suber]|uniref:receptor-like protein 7 n=1 Tax=Quercus suber TaxID=58331 RepID=UPI0032E00B79